jgi:hypothetical protein
MLPFPSLTTATLCVLVAYPVVAEAIPEIPPYANLGVSGMLGGLLYWSMKHNDERTSKSLDKVEGAMNGVRTEIAGMRTDLKEGQDTTNELLTKALFPNGGPK